MRMGTKAQRGATLIEVVISILILGIVGAAILRGFQWSLGIFGYVDRKATAESVARSQWEFVKTQPYSVDFDYERVDSGSYSIAMTDNATLANGRQRIVYTVTSPPQADGERVTVSLEGYKVDR